MSRLIPTAAERRKEATIAFRLAHPEHCVDRPGRPSIFERAASAPREADPEVSALLDDDEGAPATFDDDLFDAEILVDRIGKAIFTTGDLCDLFQCSRQHVIRKKRSGELPPPHSQ